MGQGDFTIEYPPLHDLAASEHPVLKRAHDALINLSPEPHRDTFLKPFHREQTAEFCSSCHKVHLDVPVNGYRWFRGFNDYDNWQASGVSGQGARSFYYPAKPQKCADCHMPLVESSDPAAKNGMVRSHRFPGANTALPFVNHDTVQLKAVQDFLRDGQISVDVFAITRGAEARAGENAGVGAGGEARAASTFAVGEESGQFSAPAVLTPAVDVLGPLDKVTVPVRRGESVRVEVVVRTRKVGHFFPGGTVDAFDVWVELEARDDRGRVLLHSGAVEGGDGPVDPGAHFYRSLQLDEHGNPINKRNAFMTRSVAYVRLMPPGAADTIHYRLQIPDDAGDRISLRAKVNYRKFAWWNTQWAYAGVRDPQQPAPAVTRAYDDGRWLFSGDTSKVSGAIKAIPDIPITVMAESQASLAVVGEERAAPRGRALSGRVGPRTLERLRDRPAAAGRPQGGGGGVPEGDGDGSGLRRRAGERRARSASGRERRPARSRCSSGRSRSTRAWRRRTTSWAPRSRRSGGTTKRCGTCASPPSSIRAIASCSIRSAASSSCSGGSTKRSRRSAGAARRSRRPAGALQPDALLPGARRRRDAPRASRRSTRGSRPTNRRRRSPARTGSKSPDDNNERQQIHEHRHGAGTAVIATRRSCSAATDARDCGTARFIDARPRAAPRVRPCVVIERRRRRRRRPSPT